MDASKRVFLKWVKALASFVAVEPSEQWKWKVIGRMAKVLGRVQTFKNQWLSFSCILARLGE